MITGTKQPAQGLLPTEIGGSVKFLVGIVNPFRTHTVNRTKPTIQPTIFPSNQDIVTVHRERNYFLIGSSYSGFWDRIKTSMLVPRYWYRGFTSICGNNIVNSDCYNARRTRVKLPLSEYIHFSLSLLPWTSCVIHDTFMYYVHFWPPRRGTSEYLRLHTRSILIKCSSVLRNIVEVEGKPL